MVRRGAALKTAEVIERATQDFSSLHGHCFDLLNVSRPVSPAAALNLAKIISKLSPLLGNLIEFNIVEFLNDQKHFQGLGRWKRQDPGFPDAIFEGCVSPTPGFEIKAWFPLATEITARFKDSQTHFVGDNTHVALIAWLPRHLIYGEPYILDICVVSGASVAASRDQHYHNPPDYLVMEPEDTTARTKNLQQTNTNGFKFQGTSTELRAAKAIVQSWGKDGAKHSTSASYQALLRTELMNRFTYRLDTNFAKIDRIVHPGIETFKRKVRSMELHGHTISQWAKILASHDDEMVCKKLKKHLGITDSDTNAIVS